MAEPSWTEAEIRAATNDHYPIAAGDEDEGYGTYCRCEEWVSFDVEHIIDVLKASRLNEQTAVAALEAAPDRLLFCDGPEDQSGPQLWLSGARCATPPARFTRRM